MGIPFRGGIYSRRQYSPVMIMIRISLKKRWTILLPMQKAENEIIFTHSASFCLPSAVSFHFFFLLIVSLLDEKKEGHYSRRLIYSSNAPQGQNKKNKKCNFSGALLDENKEVKFFELCPGGITR